jgi:DNA polymerase V
MLGDFYSQGVAQLNLFDELAPRHNSARLMQVLDQLNAKNGRGRSILPARDPAAVADEAEMLSPRYTTRYGDLLRVR